MEVTFLSDSRKSVKINMDSIKKCIQRCVRVAHLLFTVIARDNTTIAPKEPFRKPIVKLSFICSRRYPTAKPI
jgi:hypothetical protein